MIMRTMTQVARAAALAMALALLPTLAQAAPCDAVRRSNTTALTVSDQLLKSICDYLGGTLSVSGSFSSTVSGFAPNGNTATLSASTSSSRVALPAGTDLRVFNTGSNPVTVKLGNGSVTVTATTGDVIPAGGWLGFTVGSNTNLAGITASGSSSLVIVGGAGLPSGAGGGGTAGGATETTLAAVLAKLSSDPATQTTLAAVLAKLSSDPATATLQSDQKTLAGAVNETAPATDTASSGLNGRLQRIAQRLTSLISALGSPFQAGGALGAGEAHIGQVGSNADVVGGSFTRPNDTTAYASGDLVANSTTAGSVVPVTIAIARVNDGTAIIPRIRLSKSGTSLTNASFRVHLYKNSPTISNGDNGAWLTTTSTHIGCFDVTIDKAFSDGAKGAGTPCTGTVVIAEASSGTKNIFALIEARAAYTPAAQEVFTIAAEVLQN